MTSRGRQGTGDHLPGFARGCIQNRWAILLSWISLTVIATLIASSDIADYDDPVITTGSDSAMALEALETNFDDLAGGRAQIVLRTNDPTGPETRDALTPMFDAIRGVEGVATVLSPWEDPSGAHFSTNNSMAYGEVIFEESASPLSSSTVTAIEQIVDEFRGLGLRIEVGGSAIDRARQADLDGNERFGLLAAVVVLLIVFASLVAAATAILVSLFGVSVALSLVGVLSGSLPVNSLGPPVVTMVGLVTGITYSLLIVTSYRSARMEGSDTISGITQAMSSGGRSVLTAGPALVISLVGVGLIGSQPIRGLAIAGAISALITMVAALTLLPAALAIAGDAFDRIRFRPLSSGPDRSLWSRWFQRAPWAWGLISLLAAVALSVPSLSLESGTSDAGVNPTDSSTRLAYDLLSEGFGEGYNGPLYISTDLRTAADPNIAVRVIRSALEGTQGIAAVDQAIINDTGAAAMIRVFPSSGPGADKTESLVQLLRVVVLPTADSNASTRSLLGGSAAELIDHDRLIGDRLIYALIVAAALTFVVLTISLRSILVSALSIIGTLLSLAAAHGVMVAVFQWGWALQILGLDRTGPIPPYASALLMVTVYGLSLNHQAMIADRSKRRYLETGDSDAAIAAGLTTVGPVIVAGAVVTATLFGSFIFSDEPSMKILGLGLAAAVIFDATIIRSALVPAIMKIAGDRAWWMPGRFAIAVPRTPTSVPGELLHSDIGVSQYTDTQTASLEAANPWMEPTDLPEALTEAEEEDDALVKDPYLAALSDHRTLDAPTAHQLDPDQTDSATSLTMERSATRARLDGLPGLFQRIAILEDDNVLALERLAEEAGDSEHSPMLNLAAQFSREHRDAAVECFDELIEAGAAEPDIGDTSSDTSGDTVADRALATTRMRARAAGLLAEGKLHEIAADELKWWHDRSLGQWKALDRSGLLMDEPTP